MVVVCGAGGVEGGITGHLLVAILDHSGYKTVTTRDHIGMFFVGVGMGVGLGKMRKITGSDI